MGRLLFRNRIPKTASVPFQSLELQLGGKHNKVGNPGSRALAGVSFLERAATEAYSGGLAAEDETTVVFKKAQGAM